ncbi:hypothetical protein CD58_11970 [Pseudomonas brassicacearum]|nr:hypothetical protein CD58_11970 [Pseudomonas brassicacearum]
MKKRPDWFGAFFCAGKSLSPITYHTSQTPVGASLLAIAAGQSTSMLLIRRHREQARSHRNCA